MKTKVVNEKIISPQIRSAFSLWKDATEAKVKIKPKKKVIYEVIPNGLTNDSILFSAKPKTSSYALPKTMIIVVKMIVVKWKLVATTFIDG